VLVLSIVIVGFRVQESKAVYYKKLVAIALGSSDDDKLLSAIKSALTRSDFISIRCLVSEVKA